MSFHGSGYPAVSVDGAGPGCSAEQLLAEKRRARRRLLHKDGSCNVGFTHLFGEWGSYVADVFTTLVDTKWRHMLVVFSLCYVLSWLAFGAVFWLIALQHGDLRRGGPGGAPCVDNVRSFAAAFLFSLETQTTIGYGHRCVTEACPAAVLAVVLQSVLGCVIHTLLVGAALAKMATARRRAQSVRFSHFALVGLRDGKLCLMWRLGDFRPRHAVAGTVRAQLLRRAEDAEGRAHVRLRDLRLRDAHVLLVAPVTVVHEIDRDSPLYALDRKAVAREDFEILVTFVYTGDSTGTSHQSRSSYVPREILWGHRFHEVLEVRRRHYRVNCLRFEGSAEVYAPFCSAEQLDWKDRQLRGGAEKAPPAPAAPDAEAGGGSLGAAALVRSSERPEETPPAAPEESKEAPHRQALLALSGLSAESQM